MSIEPRLITCDPYFEQIDSPKSSFYTTVFGLCYTTPCKRDRVSHKLEKLYHCIVQASGRKATDFYTKHDYDVEAKLLESHLVTKSGVTNHEWINEIVQSSLFNLVAKNIAATNYHRALKEVSIPATFAAWNKAPGQELPEPLKEWMATVSESFIQRTSSLPESILMDLYEKIFSKLAFSASATLFHAKLTIAVDEEMIYTEAEISGELPAEVDRKLFERWPELHQIVNLFDKSDHPAIQLFISNCLIEVLQEKPAHLLSEPFKEDVLDRMASRLLQRTSPQQREGSQLTPVPPQGFIESLQTIVHTVVRFKNCSLYAELNNETWSLIDLYLSLHRSDPLLLRHQAAAIAEVIEAHPEEYQVEIRLLIADFLQEQGEETDISFESERQECAVM